MNLGNGINEEYENDFDEESMHNDRVKDTGIQDERSAVMSQSQEIKFGNEEKIQGGENNGGNIFSEDEGEACEESVEDIFDEIVEDPIHMSDFELKLEKQGKILVFLIVIRKKSRQI